jgi:GNAT superfamily N-acetyltransferase
MPAFLVLELSWSTAESDALGMTARVARWSVNQKYKRRDSDPARLDALVAATEEVKKRYFSDAADWWSMELLVTDRDFRRRGAATRIVEWGTDEADREFLFCGVEASVMGAPLYAANGFRKLDTKVVHVPGDEASLPYDVMRREPIPK